jgi:hypothetical protein
MPAKIPEGRVRNRNAVFLVIAGLDVDPAIHLLLNFSKSILAKVDGCPDQVRA